MHLGSHRRFKGKLAERLRCRPAQRPGSASGEVLAGADGGDVPKQGTAVPRPLGMIGALLHDISHIGLGLRAWGLGLRA